MCNLNSAVANFGARFLIPSCFRSPSGLTHAPPPTRAYQVWPGKNRNCRLYLLLISLALAFHVYTFTFSVRRIRVNLDATSAGIFSLLRKMPEMFALAAFSFMAIWFLACLLPFHAFLVAKNQTSHERYKGRYRESPNPYNKGALRNIREWMFDKLPPPRVDFRAVAGPNLGSAARTTVSSAWPAPDGGAGEVLTLTVQDCTVIGANDAQTK